MHTLKASFESKLHLMYIWHYLAFEIQLDESVPDQEHARHPGFNLPDELESKALTLLHNAGAISPGKEEAFAKYFRWR